MYFQVLKLHLSPAAGYVTFYVPQRRGFHKHLHSTLILRQQE